MDIQRKLRLHMCQIDSFALSALAVAPRPVWTRYWTMPMRQSAISANDAPFFRSPVVDPKAYFSTDAVTNTAQARRALPKATVLTLRLIRNAEQTPARAPM